jgi:hypothetical protein
MAGGRAAEAVGRATIVDIQRRNPSLVPSIQQSYFFIVTLHWLACAVRSPNFGMASVTASYKPLL